MRWKKMSNMKKKKNKKNILKKIYMENFKNNYFKFLKFKNNYKVQKKKKAVIIILNQLK